MVYKMTNDLVDMPVTKYLSPCSSGTRANHSIKNLPLTSTSYSRHSFFPSIITTWNNLPASIAEDPALVSFKRGPATTRF
ncbi:hypothetical protein DPMN_102235 [Dreissena polymorpha]|uniref:Uncharacterized protein n=1 Tax=Dreissena polymorpha TaxID=45954 RepID=A0A9D4LMJ2_DREPO|nr:hypothetical protein DPMN_102235 [Dreissena polymorpha]